MTAGWRCSWSVGEWTRTWDLDEKRVFWVFVSFIVATGARLVSLEQLPLQQTPLSSF